MLSTLALLPAFADKRREVLTAVIDTPKGSRNKYALDEESGLFELKGILGAGAYFPYDFGFVPSTIGEDGDPLDVLLLMDEPAFTGCIVKSRLLGVIEAEQTENKKTARNDRLIAVPAMSLTHGAIQTLDDVPDQLLEEIEHFFVSYNEAKGKVFRPLGRRGVNRARKLVEDRMAAFAKVHRGGKRKTSAR